MKPAPIPLLIGFLVVLASCQPANPTPVASPTPLPPTLNATAAQVDAVEPTAVDFELTTEEATSEATEPALDVTANVVANAPTATLASLPTEQAPAQATFDATRSASGSFQIAITTDNADLTFDSGISEATADYQPGEETTAINFRLGAERWTGAAQQVSLALPGELTAGTYEITRDFATATAIGETGAAYIDNTDPSTRTFYSVSPEGTVTITSADASAVSGEFELKIQTVSGSTATIRGSFTTISSRPRSD